MRIVVVGLGKVGRALTAQLTAENNDIVVIDQNPDLIEDIVNIYDVRGLVGNGGCYDVQKEAFFFCAYAKEVLLRVSDDFSFLLFL